MGTFYLTNAAKADLKDIGRYTQREWGHAQRDKYLAMLDDCFHSIAAQPLKGQDCSYIREGYRKQRAASHVIFYRQVDTGVEIVRILHGSMDIERRLLDS